MRIRRVGRAEVTRLRPWREPFGRPHRRALDAAEIAELIHLHQTRQVTKANLAGRFGVSLRTVHRYLREYPDRVVLDAAGLRVLYEARRAGLEITPADAQRLAGAALSERAS